MPKTKVNSRAAPAVQLSAEDLKEVETILQDFDQQCKLSTLESGKISIVYRTTMDGSAYDVTAAILETSPVARYISTFC